MAVRTQNPTQSRPPVGNYPPTESGTGGPVSDSDRLDDRIIYGMPEPQALQKAAEQTPFIWGAGDEQLHAEALRAAGSDTPLLIMGESGTGKSALARFIHEQSERKDGPWYEVDCVTVPRAELAHQVFGPDFARSPDSAAGDRPDVFAADGGTLVIANYEEGVNALRPRLQPWLESRNPLRPGGGTLRDLSVRLILTGDQNIRRHVDKSTWQKLVAWPPILLAPLRVQRRRKWQLFQGLVEEVLAESNLKPPTSVDFLLYFFVVGYGWPGNVRQLRNFAAYLVQVQDWKDRVLQLDSELRFFDHSDAIVPAEEQAAKSGKAVARTLTFRNRVHYEFVRLMSALQHGETGIEWRELSKASPGRSGRWDYPRIRWTDPHFLSVATCARCGQFYDSARIRLEGQDEQIPEHRLHYEPDELPWTDSTRSRRVSSGLTSESLATQVAYALATGEIEDKEAFLRDVYAAIVAQAPGKSQKEYLQMGIPRVRLKELLR